MPDSANVEYHAILCIHSDSHVTWKIEENSQKVSKSFEIHLHTYLLHEQRLSQALIEHSIYDIFNFRI